MRKPRPECVGLARHLLARPPRSPRVRARHCFPLAGPPASGAREPRWGRRRSRPRPSSRSAPRRSRSTDPRSSASRRRFWTLSQDTPRTTPMPTLSLVGAAACSAAITPSPKGDLRAGQDSRRSFRLRSGATGAGCSTSSAKWRARLDRSRGCVAFVAPRHARWGLPSGRASSAR